MDCALSLYPLPDLIVIGDPSKPFETNHQGCNIVNVVSVKQTDECICAPSTNSFNFSTGVLPEIKVYIQSVRSIVQAY